MFEPRAAKIAPSRLILGIDPGSIATGWGVIRASGSRQQHVASGVIRPRSEDFPGRLLQIYDALEEVCFKYRPQEASIESLFFHQNPQSALKLGHVRGVAVLCCLKAGLAVHEYSPMEIKLALVGKGRAEKHQVGEMVKLILGLPKLPPADESDALAAAITHAQTGPLGRIPQIARRRRRAQVAGKGRRR